MFFIVLVCIVVYLILKEPKTGGGWHDAPFGKTHTAYGVTFKDPTEGRVPSTSLKVSTGLVHPFEDEDHEDDMGGEMFYVDSMDGETFEEYVAEILEAHGYQNIQTTAVSGDYGVDITAEREFIRYAIQCKRWEGSVGVHAVQEVYAGREFYKANVAMVVTNSKFTPNAKQMADKLGVVLIDRDKLYKMIETTKMKKGGQC